MMHLVLCVFFDAVFIVIKHKSMIISKQYSDQRGLRWDYTVTTIVHLMSVPRKTVSFVFPRVSMFPETKLTETTRLEGNKANCFPRQQTLSALLHIIECFVTHSSKG